MKINKGTLLDVDHTRKGKFVGMAMRDFDTDTEEWYPIALAQNQVVQGLAMGNIWIEGDEIPCRGSFCQITIRQESK